jgi:ubiquitin-conjugating enzyme E2 M
MLNILSLKKSKEESASNPNRRPKTSAAQIRIQKDLGDLNHLPNTISIEFKDPNDVFNFNVKYINLILRITPDEGFYIAGTFNFSFKVLPSYPHEPPKVLCTQKIYHPNIDLQGNVCLNILREDWKVIFL